MIVTLTANPALDRTIAVEEPLRPGEVQAALSNREDAGGKGINVARVVSDAGHETLAVLPLGTDDPFAQVLRASGVPSRPVTVPGRVRINTAITDPDGVTTKLNLPGAALSRTDRSRVIDAVAHAAEGADWLVLAGSLPPGAGADFYVDVIRAVRERCGNAAPRIAVDTSGEALRAVVESAYPDLIKPNDEELADLCGVALDADEDPVDAALRLGRRLVPANVGAALITLGGAGALLVDREGALFASPPPIDVVSTVGAGDSSLAGYLLAHAAGWNRAAMLENAVRHGSGAAALPGTRTPAPHDLPAGEIPVRTLDSHAVASERP